MSDGFAGVTIGVRIPSSGLKPLPDSGSSIAKYARGEVLLASVSVYNSLAALKSKVSVREIPWRNTVVVDVGSGPGVGTLTWLGTSYSAILTNLSGAILIAGPSGLVLTQAEFLITS